MKRGKPLTRNQKEIVRNNGLNSNDWHLLTEMEFYLNLVHKITKKTKMITKFPKKVAKSKKVEKGE